MKKSRPTIITSATTMIRIWRLVMLASPMCTRDACFMSRGTPRLLRLVSTPTNSERAMEAPMAVMRNASGGALRLSRLLVGDDLAVGHLDRPHDDLVRVELTYVREFVGVGGAGVVGRLQVV